MTYLGIDQSYSGFATTVINGKDRTNTTAVKAFPASKYKNDGDRLLYVEQHVYDLGDSHTLACIEGYSFGSKNGREKAGELGGIVKKALWENGIKYLIVQPTALKKFVLGTGKGGKNEMLLGVYKRWGVEFKDDNAADSYALARLAYLIDQPHLATFQYEREVIDAVLKADK